MFKSYIIDSDFTLRSRDPNKESKTNSLLEEDRKCYPKRASNQMPYQKIEHQIRNDTDWPPISPATPTPTSNNHNTTLTTTLPPTTQTNTKFIDVNPSMVNSTPIVANANMNGNQFELRTYNERHTPVNERIDTEFKLAVHRNRNSANRHKTRNESETSGQLTSL